MIFIITQLLLEHHQRKYSFVKFENKKTYYGGTIPVVNTISEISKNVTFASLIKSKSMYKILKKNINKIVKTKLFYEKNFKNIKIVLLI